MQRSAIRRVSVVIVTMVLTMACGHANEGLTAVTPPPSHSDRALVQSGAGAVRGVVTPDYRLFAGIPYAAPPVGPLRWQPPAPAPRWQGVRDATRYGPRCLQDSGPDPELGRKTDEDCLTLNVWTPPVAVPSKPALPVMVWIHGGAFVSGSGGIYDGRWLTRQGGIVVVTINYRLGSLGFLAHPAFGPADAIGNYGLADQQAALRWVRDNIAAFGGDPTKVTIAGESAGGMSVCDHLVAPGSAGLFRAAIIQSAPCQAQVSLPIAQKRSLDYAARLGCGTSSSAAQCLRALPADKLRTPVYYGRLGEEELSGPVVGTPMLPLDPVAAFPDGRAVKVPVMIGTNRDEFTLFVALRYLRSGHEYAPAEYSELLARTFGANASAVQAAYPLRRYDSVALAYAAAVTDGAFACVADRMAGALARTTEVYAYEFNDRAAPAPQPLRTLPFAVGASHSLELRYLFDVGGAPALDRDRRTLSAQMIDYWSQFVTFGRPRAVGGPDWPTVDATTTGVRMSFQLPQSRLAADFAQVHQCRLWSSLLS